MTPILHRRHHPMPSDANDTDATPMMAPGAALRRHLLLWRRRRVVRSVIKRRETAAASLRRSMVAADGGEQQRQHQDQQQQQQQRYQLHRKRWLLTSSGSTLLVPPLPLPLPSSFKGLVPTSTAVSAATSTLQLQPPNHYRLRVGPADDVASDPFAIEMLELPSRRRRERQQRQQQRRSRGSRRRQHGAGEAEEQEEQGHGRQRGSEGGPFLFLRRRRRQRVLERGGARLRGLLGLPQEEVGSQEAERPRLRPRAPSGAGELGGGDEEKEEENEETFWEFRSNDVDVGALLAEETTAATCGAHWAAYEALAADHRLVLAGRVLDKLEAFLSAPFQQQEGGPVAAVRRALASPQGQARARLLRRRLRECDGALDELERDKGWTLAQRMFGVDTYYQYVQEPDRLALRVKLDGLLDATYAQDLFAVLKEADVWTQFIPFCDRSSIVHEFGKADMILNFRVNVPFLFLQRDALLHVYACDQADPALLADAEQQEEETKDEQGDQGRRSGSSAPPSILFVGESVRDEWLGGGAATDDESLPTAAHIDLGGLELPTAPGVGRRMELKGFRAQIIVISATAVRIKIVTTIDPKAPLPQAVLNFCTKKIAGMLIHFVKQKARKMNQDPIHDPLAVAVRRRRVFYERYLLPRIKQFNDHAGWDVVPMAALEASSPDDPPSLGRRRADMQHLQQQRQRRQRRYRRRERRRSSWREADGDSDASYSSSSSSSSWWSEGGEEAAADSEAAGLSDREPLDAGRSLLVAGRALLWDQQPWWLRTGLVYLPLTALLPFILLPSWEEACARGLVMVPPVAGLLLAQWATGCCSSEERRE